MNKESTFTFKVRPVSPGSRQLRLAVKTGLAASILASSVAVAGLRDHGPGNPTVGFPDWYRDANGLALGQCLSTDASAAGPMCLLAGTNPTGFPGNFGDEAFYATADIVIPLSGGNLHWMGHLEMAYLTATGAPPAVRDPLHPQEVVFSRERIIADIPVGCAGHYTLRTPFKVHEFDLSEGKRALTYTDDITPIPGDYNAALDGHTGPFLTWDGYATEPSLTIASAGGTVRHYIGDPNVPHGFVGSTLPAGPGHEDKVFNNYLEITPPSGCDLGNGAGVPMYSETATISGLVWDQPIADPVQLDKAVYTRDANAAGVDVWASGPKSQNIVVTAANSSTQHLPSATMKEEVKDGTGTGFYHAHLEFEPTATLPAQVTISNLSSNPVSQATRAVTDAVVVTKSEYDLETRKVCIAAHSGDQAAAGTVDSNAIPELEAEGYGKLGPSSADARCAPVDARDVVLEKDLGGSVTEFHLPPGGIVVKSSKGGSELTHPLVLAKGMTYSDGTVSQQAVDDTFAAAGAGVTALNLTGNDWGLPSGYRIVIVSQPELGKVSAPATGGTVNYEAAAGMPTSEQTFFYAIQDTGTTGHPVSNVAKVTLNVTQFIPPPVGMDDAQAVFRTSAGSTISVLANDSTGQTTSAIDKASIQIVSAPSRGTATPLADGTIRYVPVGQSLTVNNTRDTFTYTVANAAGARSTPVTVNVVLKSTAEAIGFQRVRYNGGWDLRFTSSYAGLLTTLDGTSLTLAPVATCKLYASSTTYANGTGTALGTIGSAAPGAGTNAYRISGASPVPSGSTWVVGCTTTSGGRGSRTGTL